jgi:ABC-type Mn2+/Zn2+ transport system ATPase subunit
VQDYELILKSPISETFMAKKAMQSVDLDAEEKSWHKMSIKNIDIQSPYNVGLIYGASGSGKSSLARHMFGDFEDSKIDMTKAIIDQFPDHLEYEQRQQILTSIGLSQIPCWIKPVGLLSNGQQERAKIAFELAKEKDFYIFDEWTSVVDRNVAKVMSHCVQKFARKFNKKIILISCHEDVFDWLNPDFVIDCNEQQFTDRRLLWQNYTRREQIEFTIREVDKRTWKNFSKYHYLSENLPGGIVRFYGLFLGNKQVGFQCFANYTPHKKGTKIIMHSNRTVIHPDYVGLSLGIKFVDCVSKILKAKSFRVMGKFSSTPVLKALLKNKAWRFAGKIKLASIVAGGNMARKSGFREKVTCYSFEFVG